MPPSPCRARPLICAPEICGHRVRASSSVAKFNSPDRYMKSRWEVAVSAALDVCE
jgi:hypothetical protein